MFGFFTGSVISFIIIIPWIIILLLPFIVILAGSVYTLLNVDQMSHKKIEAIPVIIKVEPPVKVIIIQHITIPPKIRRPNKDKINYLIKEHINRSKNQFRATNFNKHYAHSREY